MTTSTKPLSPRASGSTTDFETVIDGRHVRFTARPDARTERFEAELLDRQADLVGEDDRQAHLCDPGVSRLELTVPQRHAWLRHTGAEFRLMQVRDRDDRAAMQVIVQLRRPRLLPTAAEAVARKLWRATSRDEEAFGIRTLRRFCEADGEIAALRLQPRRLHASALRDFEESARREGFRLVDPESVTRTLVLDLGADEAALLATFSRDTRRNVRAPQRSAIEIRELVDARYLDAIRAAADASSSRTGGGRSQAEWGALLALAHERPDLVGCWGVFDRARPDRLLAFIAGQRHGAIAEVVYAGSLDDPTLRKLPFNYLLFWELSRWARAHGARVLDLGGVTSGRPGDPLAGISAFKRHLTRCEIEVGRELVATIQPGRAWALGAVRALASRVRASVVMPSTGARPKPLTAIEAAARSSHATTTDRRAAP